MAPPSGQSRTEGLRAPPTGPALAWLRQIDDPVIALRLATEVGRLDVGVLKGLRRSVSAHASIAAAHSRQNDDGSWGEHPEPTRRILPTLRLVQTLAEQGATGEPWRLAARFLASTAHTEEGVFSLDGRRDGVLSCYVGVAATAYLLGGLDELAESQLEWIRTHQDVRRGDRRLRADPPEAWGTYLQHRYGGCMADTTCLVGLVKAGRALQLHRDVHDDRRGDPLTASIREAFLERHLMAAADGTVVPIGAPPSSPEDWLAPTFPLDWHTDLIEIIDFVARSGPADRRMQPALDALAGFQLPDGTWPLRRTFWPDGYPIRTRRSARRGDPMVTLRATLAIEAIRSDHAAG